MYQALYRKYRPRTFEDVVGQEHVTETLKNQIENNRLSHAYLFVGTRGTGKTTCAKILARAVNCEHPVNGNPCNECKSCLGIEDGSVLDVVELDAASNNGVENVRALRDEAVYSPAAVKKRVYIIDEVHMLSTSAFNALLKILEEPPEHLLFILATTELNKIPATILSRCQRHSFKRIEPQDIAARLEYVAKMEDMQLEHDGALLLARLANGALRDGLSLLDQCSAEKTITAESIAESMGLAGNIKTAELLNKICNGQTDEAIAVFENLWQGGKAPSTVLNELCTLLRDALMTKVAPKNGGAMLSGAFDIKTVSDFAKRLSGEELVSYIDSIQEKIAVLRDGRDPKITAEICIIGLCEPRFGSDIEFLRARVARLEDAVKNGVVRTAKNENTIATEAAQAVDEIAYDQKIKNSINDDIGASFAPIQNNENNYMSAEVAPIYDDRDAPPPFSDADIPSAEHVRDVPSIEEKPANDEPMYELKPVDEEPPFDMEPPKESKFRPDDMPKHSAEKYPETIIYADEDAVGDNNVSFSDGDWSRIVAELQKTLMVGQYRIVSDSNVSRGEFANGELLIKVANDFNRRQLEQQHVREQIRSAVIKVLGSAVPIRIILDTPTSGESDKSEALDKLDALGKFGNVKFQ